VMVLAATFFATGLREGYIETGGSAAGLLAMLVALVIGVIGLLIMVGVVSSNRARRIGRPKVLLGLILAVPLVWMTTAMAVSWHYGGAVSVGDSDVEYDVGDDPRAHPENKFSDTSGAALLLGSCGMLPLGGFAIPTVVVLLRRGTSGTDANEAWSAIEGD
ncbi:MAG: hypothetical protein GY895_04455, partial [Phycisphaera sp.]|nr:hypothetical protein [Phycisphaera sp.]